MVVSPALAWSLLGVWRLFPTLHPALFNVWLNVCFVLAPPSVLAINPATWPRPGTEMYFTVIQCAFGGIFYAPAGLLIHLGRRSRVVRWLAWGLFAAWAAWTVYLIWVFQTRRPK